MQGKGYGSSAWMSFVEWLLWGFGANIQEGFPSKVTEEISWHWYQTFNMSLMMKHPCDYMPWAACPAHGLVDWTTDKDKAGVLGAIDAWRSTRAGQPLMLMFKPKTNTLSDWI